eukprot:4829869-Pleurochrysis_carterae.AAC.1
MPVPAAQQSSRQLNHELKKLDELATGAPKRPWLEEEEDPNVEPKMPAVRLCKELVTPAGWGKPRRNGKRA